MSRASRYRRARGSHGWAIALLLIAALPFASLRTGATGTIFTATTVPALIADINAANANPAQGPYTINLAPSGVYTLVAEAAAGSATGLPGIVSGVNLTIIGNGATIQRSAAGGTPDFRVLLVNSGAIVRLDTLVVRNGSVVGAVGMSGAPGSPGTNGANAPGGAIFNSGMLTVVGSTLTSNRVVSGAGGNGGDGHDMTGVKGDNGGLGGNAGNASGGAIGNLGTLVVMESTFSGNTAVGGAGGSGGNGGNSTGAPGGAGGNAGKGGGATGGALHNSGTMTVTNSTFVGNSVTGGTGGNGGSPGTGTGGSIAGFGASGGAGQGGAIAVTGGALTVTNGTITANSATGGAGGTGSGGQVGQTAGSGGGLRTPGGGVTVKNTILAGNTAMGDGNCGGLVMDGGNNVEFNPATTCGFTNPQTGDPLLGALANHGGPTETMALGPGSAAINTGNPTVCAETSGVAPVSGRDQRGLPRPAGQCSIGAFEPQPAPFPTLDALSPSSGSTAGGSKITLSGTGFVSGITVSFGTAAATVTAVTTGTAITVTAPAHAAGTVDVTVTNQDGQAATLSAAYTFGAVTTLPGPQPTAPPAATKPKPLPISPRPTAAPSGNGTPLPLPPPR